jgi:MoxR-like ATPase
MQEKLVTIGDKTYTLDEPFMVLATQNPIEQEGTYPLPEAQVDRFMLKVIITYPTPEEEGKIIEQNTMHDGVDISKVLSAETILKARGQLRDIYLDAKVEKYILDIVFATRFPDKHKLPKLKGLLRYGSSPRGSINLAMGAKALAFMNHRGYVIPEDVRNICLDVLRHRIGLTYEAEAENITTDEIINEVLKVVQVP